MTSVEEQAAARVASATWHEFQQRFPAVAAQLRALDDPPSPLRKPGVGTDIVKIRLHPKVLQPKSFWSSTWCCYQISVGQENSAICRPRTSFGAVLFFMFPHNKQCGGGRYLQPVLDILRPLASTKSNWFFKTPGPVKSKQRGIFFGTSYDLPLYSDFPVLQAAEDLAALVDDTLSAFAALAACP